MTAARALRPCRVTRSRPLNSFRGWSRYGRIAVEDFLSHDGSRLVDGLHCLRVGEHDEAEGREGAVGPVGHGEVDAIGALGGGLLGEGGVASREGQELTVRQLEAVCRLKGGQGRRARDEFFRRRELHRPALADVAREVLERRELFLVGEVLSDRDRPGIVRWRGREPHDPVLLEVELLDRFVAFLLVLPYRRIGSLEEEGAVAGILDVEVELLWPRWPCARGRSCRSRLCPPRVCRSRIGG